MQEVTSMRKRQSKTWGEAHKAKGYSYYVAAEARQATNQGSELAIHQRDVGTHSPFNIGDQ